MLAAYFEFDDVPGPVRDQAAEHSAQLYDLIRKLVKVRLPEADADAVAATIDGLALSHLMRFRLMRDENAREHTMHAFRSAAETSTFATGSLKMARSGIRNLDNGLRMFLLRSYGKLAPARFQKRFMPPRIFSSPTVRFCRRANAPICRSRISRCGVPVGGGIGLISDTWVQAWRWGEGPAVLVVHGWEDDHHCFDAIIAALVKRGQAVVALDPLRAEIQQRNRPFRSPHRQPKVSRTRWVRCARWWGIRSAAPAATFAITEGWLGVERGGDAAPTARLIC